MRTWPWSWLDGMQRKATKRSPGASVPRTVDKVLLQHLTAYAINNDVGDLDEVVEHLRRTHKLYQRTQLRALKLKTERAIKALQAQPKAAAELKLQVSPSPPPPPPRRPISPPAAGPCLMRGCQPA